MEKDGGDGRKEEEERTGEEPGVVELSKEKRPEDRRDE